MFYWRIVCLFLQDEGTFHLKEAAKNLLKSLGSQASLILSWRDMWTLVVKKGGRGAKLTLKQIYFCLFLSSLPVQYLYKKQHQTSVHRLWTRDLNSFAWYRSPPNQISLLKDIYFKNVYFIIPFVEKKMSYLLFPACKWRFFGFLTKEAIWRLTSGSGKF